MRAFFARKRPHVVFDIQHYGVPGGGTFGANADFDGDGHTAIWEKEAALTPMYVYAAQRRLQAFRTYIQPTTFESYQERSEKLILEARRRSVPTVVLLAHLNAGGGDESITFYQRAQDQDLAASIADSIRRNVGELPVSIPIRATPDDWTKRAHFCLDFYSEAPSNVYVALLEPWFLDNEDHASLAGGDGPIRIGRAIAKGVKAFLKEEGYGT